MTTDIQALLGGVLPFWNKLSAAEKAKMAAGTRLRDFAAGSVVTGIRNSCPGMSLNLLVKDSTEPVIWRGPAIADVVKQFWSKVIWSGEEYMKRLARFVKKLRGK